MVFSLHLQAFPRIASCAWRLTVDIVAHVGWGITRDLSLHVGSSAFILNSQPLGRKGKTVDRSSAARAGTRCMSLLSHLQAFPRIASCAWRLTVESKERECWIFCWMAVELREWLAVTRSTFYSWRTSTCKDVLRLTIQHARRHKDYAQARDIDGGSLNLSQHL
jgi:hypothetical protein